MYFTRIKHKTQNEPSNKKVASLRLDIPLLLIQVIPVGCNEMIQDTSFLQLNRVVLVRKESQDD